MRGGVKSPEAIPTAKEDFRGRSRGRSTVSIGGGSEGARITRRVRRSAKINRPKCLHCGARLAWDNPAPYCGPHSTPEKRGERDVEEEIKVRNALVKMGMSVWGRRIPARSFCRKTI